MHWFQAFARMTGLDSKVRGYPEPETSFDTVGLDCIAIIVKFSLFGLYMDHQVFICFVYRS